jgi:hypothetical protein
MDGVGISGLKLDFCKMQTFLIDMECIGRIRFGFYVYGKIQYCHQIDNINVSYQPFTSSVNLPIRYEIDGITGGTGYITMSQINSTVISEGGYNPVQRPFSASNYTTDNLINETPILALRGGGNNYYHQNILINRVSIGSNWGNQMADVLLYRIRLYIDPQNTSYPGNITGWTNVNDYNLTTGTLSVTQYNTTGINTFFSTDNSIIVDQGTVIGKGGNKFSNYSNNYNESIEITGNYNNISNILILTVQNLSNSGANGYTCGTIYWTEIY